MKNKWIKVIDSLPLLRDISPTWAMSDTVLALVANYYPVIAVYNYNEGKGEWLLSGRGDITHWQYIELPE